MPRCLQTFIYLTGGTSQTCIKGSSKSMWQYICQFILILLGAHHKLALKAHQSKIHKAKYLPIYMLLSLNIVLYHSTSRISHEIVHCEYVHCIYQWYVWCKKLVLRISRLKCTKKLFKRFVNEPKCQCIYKKITNI